jgi:hypothetical protein
MMRGWRALPSCDLRRSSKVCGSLMVCSKNLFSGQAAEELRIHMHELTGTVCLPGLQSTRRQLSLAHQSRPQAISVWMASTWSIVFMVACNWLSP